MIDLFLVPIINWREHVLSLPLFFGEDFKDSIGGAE